MIYPNDKDLDLERLHAVLEVLPTSVYRKRRQGSTTAYLSLMLAEVELGDTGNRYLYVAETNAFAERVGAEFMQLVKDYYHPDVVAPGSNYRKVVLGNQLIFEFISVDRVAGILPGSRFCRVFFDVTEAKMNRLDQAGEMERIWHGLERSLIVDDGDII